MKTDLAPPPAGSVDVLQVLGRFAPVIFLLVLMAAFALLEPRFLQPLNLFNVMRQISITGLIAIGMTFVILTAGIDLSVGSMLALAGLVAAAVAKGGLADRFTVGAAQDAAGYGWFPAMLADSGAYQRLAAEWHLRLAEAILRNWEVSDEIVDAVTLSDDPDREHGGTTDLADVLAVAGALASLPPDPRAGDMLFLGMPAARRMNLDATACGAALAESQEAIASLRQALSA